jgi:hypothetical protein
VETAVEPRVPHRSRRAPRGEVRSSSMKAAIIGMCVVLSVALIASVGLFWVDQPAAGWSALVVGLFGTLAVLSMVATTARSE